MARLSVLLCVVLGLTAVFAKDSDVLVLTEENFDATIKEHSAILVEFYAPWCGHCKSLAPEYEKAATLLKKSDPPVAVAKVDATEQEELAGKFDIQGFPTLKFFRDGVPMEYGGGRTADTIVSWVQKRMGPVAKHLKTKEDVDAFVDAAEVAVVAFFAELEGDAHKAFEKVALKNDDTPFGYVSDAGVASKFEATAPSLVLFKKFDEGKAVYSGEFTADAIAQFVGANSLPLVVEFNEKTAPKIFGGDIKTQVLLFGDIKADSVKPVVDVYRTVAGSFKGKALFVTIDKEEDRILEFFGLTEADLPAVRIVQLMDNDLAKYQYEGKTITESELNEFMENFFAGKLKRHLKSEAAYDNKDAAVLQVVGTNFNEIVMDATKDVLVEFYAPWCGHCKQLEPIYKKLGETLKNVENLVIAKVDATANEMENVEIRGFPTIKFFPANNKAEPLDFEGPRALKSFVKYLKEHASAAKIDIDLSTLPEDSMGGEDEEEFDDEHDHDHDHDHDHEHDHDHDHEHHHGDEKKDEL